MAGWKRMKGISQDFDCSKCGRVFSSDEFDEHEDLCVYCLFEGVGVSRPTDVSYDYGVARNRTRERELLDNLDYVPEKQSKQAKESYRKYQERSYTRKNNK